METQAQSRDSPGTGTANDVRTADAFTNSWNNLPAGSVYTREQFEEWLLPVTAEDARGCEVLELGCGNASLLVHMTAWDPARVEGVDLGDSVLAARANMERASACDWTITQADLTAFDGPGFDLVYCIGVLHHLAEPRRGFEAVVRNTRPGGRFHCWVYAREGNAVIRLLVEPLRRICSRLPWWFTKYLVATPLVVPYFLYAKLMSWLPRWRVLEKLPLYSYALWISQRGFPFFRHVAFDQLVTPRTLYIPRSAVEDWLAGHPEVEPDSVYIVRRNGNSWKFGGRRRGEGADPV